MNRKEMFLTPLWKDIRGRIKKKDVKKVADALELEIREETDILFDRGLLSSFVFGESVNGFTFWNKVYREEF